MIGLITTTLYVITTKLVVITTNLIERIQLPFPIIPAHLLFPSHHLPLMHLPHRHDITHNIIPLGVERHMQFLVLANVSFHLG